jgi:hypothetical protein
VKTGMQMEETDVIGLWGSEINFYLHIVLC